MRGVDTGEPNSIREACLLKYQEKENNRQVHFLATLAAAIAQNGEGAADSFKKYAELTLPGVDFQTNAPKNKKKSKEEAAEDLKNAFKEVESLWQTKD
jgi:hypothetical protein